MQLEDRRIDPITRDYVDDGAGGDISVTDLEVDVYLALAVRRNRWWANPDAGSDLWLAKQSVETASRVRTTVDSVKRALQAFVDSNRAAELQVDVDTAQTGRLGLSISLRDLTQGGQVDLTLDPFRS